MLFERAGLLSFIALFLGFAAYQALVAIGLPAQLGRYTGTAALITFPVLIAAYALQMSSRRHRTAIDAVFILTAAYMALWTWLAPRDPVDPSVPIDVAGGLVICAVHFLIGRTLPAQSRTLNTAALCTVAAAVLLVLSYSTNGVFRLGIGGNATYQSYGLLIVIAAAVTLATSPSRILRLSLMAVVLPILYLNGARSELLAFFLFCALLLLMSRASIWTLAAGSLGIYFAWTNFYRLEQLTSNRITAAIFYGSTGSERARDFANEAALETLRRAPLLGEFAGYQPGGYAHNILSVWVDFGMLGLIFFGLLIILPLIKAARIRPSSDVFAHGALSIFLATLPLLLFAKYFAYPLFAFALGMLTNALSQTPLRARETLY